MFNGLASAAQILAAVVSALLTISVSADASAHGSLRAQDTQSAIENARRLAEYLDEANSRIAEMAGRGEIRSDPVLAVIVDSPMEFRDDPPHGLLNLFIGEVMGELKPGTVFDIQEEKIIPTFDGGEVWYSIQILYLPDEENVQRMDGWINAGVSGFRGLMVASQVAGR